MDVCCRQALNIHNETQLEAASGPLNIFRQSGLIIMHIQLKAQPRRVFLFVASPKKTWRRLIDKLATTSM